MKRGMNVEIDMTIEKEKCSSKVKYILFHRKSFLVLLVLFTWNSKKDIQVSSLGGNIQADSRRLSYQSTKIHLLLGGKKKHAITQH